MSPVRTCLVSPILKGSFVTVAALHNRTHTGRDSHASQLPHRPRGIPPGHRPRCPPRRPIWEILRCGELELGVALLEEGVDPLCTEYSNVWAGTVHEGPPQLTSSTSALEPVQAITRDSSIVACSGVSERVSSQRFSATAMPDVPAATSSASS